MEREPATADLSSSKWLLLTRSLASAALAAPAGTAASAAASASAEVVSSGSNQAVMGGRARDGSSHVPCCPGKPHHQSRADNLWLLPAPTDCALVERNGQAALVLTTHSRSHGVGDREQEAPMGRGSDHSRVQWAPQADYLQCQGRKRDGWPTNCTVLGSNTKCEVFLHFDFDIDLECAECHIDSEFYLIDGDTCGPWAHCECDQPAVRTTAGLRIFPKGQGVGSELF